MIEFHEALDDGQIPVRIAKRINFGLGYPFFSFNYPLLYHVGDALQRVGLSVLDAFKALLIGAAVISSISMYAWLLPYAGRMAALIGAIFWVIAPYKFLNMYVRGNVAESLGLAMVSLGFLVMDRFVRGGLAGIIVVFYFASFLLSHNITVLVGLPLLFLYAVWITFAFKLEKKRLMYLFGYLVSALAMTAFFWYPAIVEAPLTKLAELRSDYVSYFPTLLDIIYSPWGFGSFARDLVPGKMSVQLGLVHTLIIGVALVLLLVGLWRKHRIVSHIESLVVFFSLIAGVSAFLTLDVSRPVWDAMPILQYVQIPWRFVGYLTLASSVLAAYILSTLPKLAKCITSVLLVGLLFYSNRNHIRVNQYIPFENPFEKSEIYGPSTTSKDEHMPLWAPHIYEAPKPDGDIFPATAGTSKRGVWQSNVHKFTVSFSADAAFRDNTSYFPGWTAQVDGQSVPIRYRDDPFGRLFVSVPKGDHVVSFRFGEPLYRKVADIVSLLALVFFLANLVVKGLKYKSEAIIKDQKFSGKA